MEDETDETLSTLSGDIETEIKEMMGLFDAPAFARRGLELEEMLRRARTSGAGRRAPSGSTWSGSGCGSGRASRPGRTTGPPSSPPRSSRSGRSREAEPPQWAAASAPRHRQLAVARDLIAAVERFNRRWIEFLERLNLGPANVVIDHYNRYYVLEKECVMGSGRLAARFFTPIPLLTPEGSSGTIRCCPSRP